MQGRVLKVEATDLILDSPGRHTGGTGPNRRASIHDQNDGLTVNFNGDYPGGVAVNGRTINLNGPSGALIRLDGSGDRRDQVTLHASFISPDTLQAYGNSAGDIKFTFQNPGDFDQDGNQRTPDFPETVSLGALLVQLRNKISVLQFRVTQLESK